MITDRSQFLYTETGELVEQVKRIALPLENTSDLDPLLEDMEQARYVLLGAASYGTAEDYLWRARLTQRLIREKGFSFIAVEDDWSACYPLNRYIKGYPASGASTLEVLTAWERWPAWPWANWEMVALLEWLRQENGQREAKIGFYGLDSYNLREMMTLITSYLQPVDPEAAEAARQAWVTFEPFARDVQADTGEISLFPPEFEDQIINLLIQRHADNSPARLSMDPEAAFETEQSRVLAENAPQYYRTLAWGNVTSWNIRAHHLVDNLDRLTAFHGSEARAIIWAHNSHVADARATDKAEFGRVNLGQLVREWRSEADVVLIGSGLYRGNVVAAQNWSAPPELMPVPQAPEGSWSDVLHQAGACPQLLRLPAIRNAEPFLEPRGHRAIGLVYNTARERFSNFIPVVLPQGYDAFLYFDETQALHPLHSPFEPLVRQPGLYPWGL